MSSSVHFLLLLCHCYFLFIVLIHGNEIVVEEEEIFYKTPDAPPNVYLAENFDSLESFEKTWVKSSARKNDDGQEKQSLIYDGLWSLETALKDPLSGDSGLVLKSKAKHSAIATRLKKNFDFESSKALIVQYEVNLQNGQDCGGAYIKLLSFHGSQGQQEDLRSFHDKTPYSIMFGPDKCGSDSKYHFIIRHVHPLNSSHVEEKHVKKIDVKHRSTFEEALKDKRPHLYRLILRSDNTYEMTLDYKIINHGSLLKDFEPAFQPPAEIEDPEDRKPEDWDEREKIPDPESSKPEDWDESQPEEVVDSEAVMPVGWLVDEPSMISDPKAEKPEDWDEEMDGEWEAPLIENPICSSGPGCGFWSQPMKANPLFKGKWTPALINNPNYKGKWKARKIKNPDYYEDSDPYSRITSLGAVGFELWSMSEDIYFDNIIITESVADADSWASETFDLKVQKLDVNDAGIFRRILLYSNRNPWLYAVYVVVIGLPLVLIVTFCCSGSSSSSSSSVSGKSALNDPKKTDDVTQDDKDDDEYDEKEDEEEKEKKENDEEEEEKEKEIPRNQDDRDDVPLVEQRTSPRKRRARKE